MNGSTFFFSVTMSVPQTLLGPIKTRHKNRSVCAHKLEHPSKLFHSVYSQTAARA